MRAGTSLVTFALLAMLSAAVRAGSVSLPHVGAADSAGNQWVVYQQGMLQQQGNMPVFSQGARITLNGQSVRSRDNTVRTDDKTGEIVFENMQVGALQLTRRILIDKDGRYVRYADVISNPSPQQVTASVNLQTALNFGINGSSVVGEGKQKDLPLAGIANLHNQRSAIHVIAGRSGKVRPTVQMNPGNSNMAATCSFPVEPGKTAVLVHLFATANQGEEAKLLRDLRDVDVLRTLPSDLRPRVVNFGGSGFFAGDVDLLRGEAFDVVELRTGDQLRGTVRQPRYTLQTFYGTLDLQTDHVAGLINAGDFRPRQLVVTRDGEVFGGELKSESIPLELTSGQTLNIPLERIARLGYRTPPGQAEEPAADRAMVMMIAGDRITVQPPAQPIPLVTRYGTWELKPESLAAIDFVDDEQPVHRVSLRDGSRFAAVVTAPQIELTLGPAAGGQVVRFPTSALRRLQLGAAVEDTGDDAALAELVNDDRLVAQLTGRLQLHTAFDTIALEGEQIADLTRAEDGPDVQITLWDGTTMKGRLQEDALHVRLAGGLDVTLPVPLVRRYHQPAPQPPASVVERVRGIVARLSADDWKERDRAQDELIALGPSVLPALKSLRPHQTPEAQQRIDHVTATLVKAKP